MRNFPSNVGLRKRWHTLELLPIVTCMGYRQQRAKQNWKVVAWPPAPLVSPYHCHPLNRRWIYTIVSQLYQKRVHIHTQFKHKWVRCFNYCATSPFQVFPIFFSSSSTHTHTHSCPCVCLQRIFFFFLFLINKRDAICCSPVVLTADIVICPPFFSNFIFLWFVPSCRRHSNFVLISRACYDVWFFSQVNDDTCHRHFSPMRQREKKRAQSRCAFSFYLFPFHYLLRLQTTSPTPHFLLPANDVVWCAYLYRHADACEWMQRAAVQAPFLLRDDPSSNVLTRLPPPYRLVRIRQPFHATICYQGDQPAFAAFLQTMHYYLFS